MSGQGPKSEAAPTRREDPRIPRASFNSDEYPEADRANAYQTIVAGPAQLTPLAEPFYARITGYVAEPVRFHYVEAIPHRFERSTLKIEMDSADYFVVQHLIEGEVEGDCDGKPFDAPESSVYCLNFRQPSLLIEKRRTRLHFVTINRQTAFERFGDLRALHGAVFSKERASSYIGFLERVYPRLCAMRRSEVGEVVNETLSELVKLFAEITAPAAESLLERAQRHVVRRLGSRDLTPESIADALSVSRSQLYVAFYDVGGVAKYIWGQRLQHVQAALMVPGESRTLTELAIDFGFTSPAHLSSAYRRVYGHAPSRMRQSRQKS